jgi:glycosyltransferase involved in cell wall biosynthesis
LIYFGFADDRQKYYELLMSADILPVTSRQDFFGISTVEAISAGVTPVLPDRLAYSEHLTKELKSKYIYREGRLLQKVLEFIHDKTANEDLVRHVSRYKWERMIKIYDERFDYLIRDRC